MDTPKTLVQAIVNGLDDSLGHALPENVNDARTIQKHVRDFMSQKFGIARMKVSGEAEDEKLRELWLNLTGEVLK